MKTNMKHNTLLLLACLLMLANIGFSQAEVKSSASVAPATAMESPVNNWQTQFTTESLSATDVEGFEVRAEQKVKDFYNYLSIISNPQYDVKLRQGAEKQALDIFSNSNCIIDKEPIDKFLDSCIKVKQAITWHVNNVNVKQKLGMMDGDPEYDGSLTCSLSNGAGTAQTKTIYIHLYKKVKQFGSESEMVWTVTICDIK
jgi:hypothetical protein